MSLEEGWKEGRRGKGEGQGFIGRRWCLGEDGTGVGVEPLHKGHGRDALPLQYLVLVRNHPPTHAALSLP